MQVEPEYLSQHRAAEKNAENAATPNRCSNYKRTEARTKISHTKKNMPHDLGKKNPECEGTISKL